MRFLAVVLVAPLVSSPARADVYAFETPSGNIGCSIGTGEGPSDIECEIFDRSGPPATHRPPGCRGVWGYRFTMRQYGGVTPRCDSSGAGGPPGNAVPYGDDLTLGGISCQSSRQGLTCRNEDGHGWFLSRRHQSVF